jgi:hypothetical protein
MQYHDSLMDFNSLAYFANLTQKMGPDIAVGRTGNVILYIERRNSLSRFEAVTDPGVGQNVTRVSFIWFQFLS